MGWPGAVASLAPLVHRRFAVKKVQVEAERVHEVPGCGRHVGDGQNGLNAKEPMMCGEFGRHVGRVCAYISAANV